MASFFNELPLALLLSALVGIFLSLWRGSRTPQFQLWLTGWVLITVHSLLRLIPPQGPLLAGLIYTFHTAALGIAGIAFLLSFSQIVSEPKWRMGVFLVVGGAFAAFGALTAFGVTNRWIHFSVAAFTYGSGALAHLFWHKQKDAFAILIVSLTLALGAPGLWLLARNDLTGGFYAMLLAIYFSCAVLTMRTNHRLSPGSVATAIGFVSWSSVWAVAAYAPKILDAIGRQSELWNVPKILVAFGMIVLELENRSRAARRAELRQQNLSRQVSRFAELTSKLLSGVEVRAFCKEIAKEIVDVSNFGRVIILLIDDVGRFTMAGSAGVPPGVENRIRDYISSTSIDRLTAVISRGRPLGAISVICNLGTRDDQISLLRSSRSYGQNDYWGENEFLLVPLRSPLGNVVGCICLDEPKDWELLTAQEMGAIEMLASDIGVAIQKASMQRKVLVQEKLASVGQLVGGVAHELNNPLTVIIGYSELLAEADPEGRNARELGVMRREALRMRSIIENLLRFARQSKVHTRSANLSHAIRDALALREYDLTRASVTVERDVPADLPPVVIDETQLKTVLVNLLNNAYDAVLSSTERKITLFARRIGKRVIVSVVDTGTGFKDLNRAFDPFFSTKGLGRGPGLGLSICYGIVKQFGGEIYAQNSVPNGACVTLELLVAEEAAASTAKQ